MRERLDCVAVVVDEETWAAPLLGRQAGGRLVIHPLAVTGVGLGQALSGQAVALRRYDACLLYVDEHKLAALRTSLSALGRRLDTLLIAYAHDLRAQALQDLYALGISDFIRPPFCAESLRARIERLLDIGGGRLGALGLGEGAPPYGTQDEALDETMDEAGLCATILRRSGMELEAYAIASASRSATSRESFRAAKSRIVERFEKAYIRAALGRHGGNVAMAARSAQKHRRAFWELMRKHDIDADPYRSPVPPNHPRDG